MRLARITGDRKARAIADRGLLFWILMSTIVFMLVMGMACIYQWYISPVPDFSDRVDGKCYVTDALVFYVECPDGARFAMERFVRNLPYGVIAMIALFPLSLPYWLGLFALVVALGWLLRRVAFR